MQRILLTSCILVTLNMCIEAATSTAKPERPNIILIRANDSGWGDVGCYGRKRIQTPHLDRMVAEGIRFTSAHYGVN